MNVDQLAGRLGIQYYQVLYLERVGVFPRAKRTRTNDRTYTEKDAKKLKSIYEKYIIEKSSEEEAERVKQNQ